jgi:G:T/U-mismatch repair DNA glycosylase
MGIVKHRFISHKISPETEILIIGTFNPDTPENIADFFYGRQRNYLWTLVPTAFGEANLKGKPREEKTDFIQTRKIDFIDLISEVNVQEEANYDDSYLDSKVSKWTDVISEIEKLRNIKSVCFTRKTFTDIPNMKLKIEEIREFCEKRKINFKYLTTPARFYRADKQQEWLNFFINGH